MTDIKTTISILCKHLNLLFSFSIKPEVFRLAKFNKSDNDAVKILWILLSKFAKLSDSNNIVDSVKCFFLHNLKYKCIHFYALPEDMSSGSRELLLAFAYFLSKDGLNSYIKTILNNSPFVLNTQFNGQIINKPEKYSFDLGKFKNEDDLNNALQWIEGQLTINEKIYQEYEMQSHKLLAKVKQCLPYLDVDINKLNASQILAFSDNRCAKEFLENTEYISKIIAYHEHWLNHEVKFWKWMSSVLREKGKVSNQINFTELDNYLQNLLIN